MTNVTKPKAGAQKSQSFKGLKFQVCVAYPPELVEQLKALSQATRVPMASYYKEALQDLIKKYAAVLRRLK